MTVITKRFEVESRGENVVDLTPEVQRCVSETNMANGVVTIFVTGSTGAVTTIEYEPGLVKDFPDMLERVAPRGSSYEHQKARNDGNGHSHLKASLVSPSLVVPFVDRKLTLGTWRQIVFVELDIRHRSRKLVLQIVGE